MPTGRELTEYREGKAELVRIRPSVRMSLYESSPPRKRKNLAQSDHTESVQELTTRKVGKSGTTIDNFFLCVFSGESLSSSTNRTADCVFYYFTLAVSQVHCESGA